MRLDKVLPDEWEDVVYYRSKELMSKILFNYFNNSIPLEGCIECPCLQTKMSAGVLYTRCIAITKCIKQYPHIEDNEEFR